MGVHTRGCWGGCLWCQGMFVGNHLCRVVLHEMVVGRCPCYGCGTLCVSVQCAVAYATVLAVQLAVRGLGSATETSVRMNDQGMLAIIHKIVGDDDKSCVVSFTLLPDIHEDSEGEA